MHAEKVKSASCCLLPCLFNNVKGKAVTCEPIFAKRIKKDTFRESVFFRWAICKSLLPITEIIMGKNRFFGFSIKVFNAAISVLFGIAKQIQKCKGGDS